MDWLKADRNDRFSYEMLDPHDVNVSRGTLEGVVSASYSEGYYVDTRYSAKLTTVNGNYIENSLIRITHIVDEFDYTNCIGTFFVDDITTEYVGNARIDEFELSSTLSRVEDDKFEFTYSYGGSSGSSAQGFIRKLLGECGVQYDIKASCGDHDYSKVKTFAAGDSKLSAIFDAVSDMEARIEVDGKGIVTVIPYIVPSAKQPIMSISDSNGTIIGSIKQEDSRYSAGNRAIVVYKNGDTEISGYADLDSTSYLSSARTGRVKADVYNVTEMNPATKEKATQIATSNVSNNKSAKTFKFGTIYLPITRGDVVELDLSANGKYKVMLQSRDIDLTNGMPCTCVFKEVSVA